MGRPDWSEQFLKQGDELAILKTETAQLFLSRTRDEWIKLLQDEDICFTAVNDLQDIETDPYLNERGMFIENEHSSVGKFKTINQPLKFKESNFVNQWSAPDLGDDSAGILRELNYNDDRISELRNKSVVKLKS